MEDGEISPSPFTAQPPLSPLSEENTPLTRQLIQIAKELDVEINPVEEMELDESPFPPHLQHLDKLLSPDRRADTPGHLRHADGRYGCKVEACDAITFCRYDAFTRHWAQVHKRKIMHVCCPDPHCGYSSIRADDVKKHTTAAHSNLANSKFLRKLLVNAKYIDPGVYDSPKKANQENVDPKVNIEVKILKSGKRKINETFQKQQNIPIELAKPIQIPARYVPEEMDEQQLRKTLITIQKQKTDILKEEDMLRSKLASINAVHWQQRYEKASKALEEERQVRKQMETRVAELEKIVTPEVMALLMILQKK